LGNKDGEEIYVKDGALSVEILFHASGAGWGSHIILIISATKF
jgi:hypothetical protein